MKRWQQWEKDILTESIKNHPTNLNFAFEQCANRLNRNAKTISAYYYYKHKKQSTIIAVGSEKRISIGNVKNTPIYRDNKLTNEDIIDLLKSQMHRFNRKEKVMMLNLLIN